MWWVVGGLLVVLILFGRQLIGIWISPQSAGVNYLWTLLKQRGIGIGSLPVGAVDALVSEQVQLARNSVGDSSLAVKTDLVRRMQLLAEELSDFFEGRLDRSSPYFDRFQSLGVRTRAELEGVARR